MSLICQAAVATADEISIGLFLPLLVDVFRWSDVEILRNPAAPGMQTPKKPAAGALAPAAALERRCG